MVLVPRQFSAAKGPRQTHQSTHPRAMCQYDLPSQQKTGLTAFSILNSFVTIHNVLDDFYQDVQAAAEIVTAQIGQFTSQYY